MSGVQYPSMGLPMECAGDELLASPAEGGLPLLALRPLPAALAAAVGRRLSSDFLQLELPLPPLPPPAPEY